MLLSTRLDEDAIEAQERNAVEMPEIATDKLQIVVHGSGGDLQISIGEHLALCFQLGAELAVHSGRSHIIGECGQSRQYPLSNIGQMPFPRLRAKGASVQLADDYRTGKLLFAGNGPEPVHIGRPWPGTQQLGDGVRVE